MFYIEGLDWDIKKVGGSDEMSLVKVVWEVYRGEREWKFHCVFLYCK